MLTSHLYVLQTKVTSFYSVNKTMIDSHFSAISNLVGYRKNVSSKMSIMCDFSLYFQTIFIGNFLLSIHHFVDTSRKFLSLNSSLILISNFQVYFFCFVFLTQKMLVFMFCRRNFDLNRLRKFSV